MPSHTKRSTITVTVTKVEHFVTKVQHSQHRKMSEPNHGDDMTEAIDSPAKPPPIAAEAVVTPDVSEDHMEEEGKKEAADESVNERLQSSEPLEPLESSANIAHEQIMAQLPPSTTRAEEDARLSAEEDQQYKAEEEARMQAEQEPLRQQEEEIAKQQAEEEARVQADHEPERLHSEALTRDMAEEEARMQADQELARWEAEEQARGRAEEDARLQVHRTGNENESLNAGQEISVPSEDDAGIADDYDMVNPNIPFEISHEAQVQLVQEDIASTSCINQPEETDKPADELDLTKVVEYEAEAPVDESVEEKTPAEANETVAEKTEESYQENILSLEETVVAASEENDTTNTESVEKPEQLRTETEQDDGREQKLQEKEPETQPENEVNKVDSEHTVHSDVPLSEPQSSSVSVASVACGGEQGGTNSGGMTFANAFGGATKESPPPIISTEVETPHSTESRSLEEDSKSDTSLTAFGAAKSKRVSNLVSKYMDNVTKDPLPGDSIKLESSSKSLSFSPTPSPVTPKPTVNLQDLPKIEDIRAKFEDSAKSSHSNVFEFGEAFRQKQRFSLLADKEKKKEAQMKLHGYDELILAKTNGATGEVDTSNIEKTFSFQTSNEDVALHDGTCKIDYHNETYQGMVFVVHRSRGMLLFNYYDPAGGESNSLGDTRIPGGAISEEEFVAAAKQTGYAKMQLQLAAREAAARQLFEMTGIDVRQKLDRLTPAVLQMNPQVDSKGTQYLRNEHENTLYYFLQISDEDFVAEQTEGSSPLTTPNGEVNSPLKLRLSGGFADFTFIKDPLVAAEELNENGDPGVTTALSMVMNQSIGPTGDPAKATSYEAQSGAQSVLIPTSADDWIGGITVVQAMKDANMVESLINRTDNEAALLPKASLDSEQQVVVDCCCGGFW